MEFDFFPKNPPAALLRMAQGGAQKWKVSYKTNFSPNVGIGDSGWRKYFVPPTYSERECAWVLVEEYSDQYMAGHNAVWHGNGKCPDPTHGFCWQRVFSAEIPPIERYVDFRPSERIAERFSPLTEEQLQRFEALESAILTARETCNNACGAASKELKKATDAQYYHNRENGMGHAEAVSNAVLEKERAPLYAVYNAALNAAVTEKKKTLSTLEVEIDYKGKVLAELFSGERPHPMGGLAAGGKDAE